MDMNKLNYLLHDIHVQEYGDFNELYNTYCKKIKEIANSKYSKVKDKALYSVLDFIQEIWILLLQDLLEHQYIFNTQEEFYMYLNVISENALNIINK